MLSNISQAPTRVTQQGIRDYEMQDPWIRIQAISLYQAWLNEGNFLISKGFLGQSGYTGVRKLSP